jgi:ribosomal-protein-alanine N-acetyltransferase
MLREFSNWLTWVSHPLPVELKKFHQLIQVRGHEFDLTPAQYRDVPEMVDVEHEAYNGEEPWSDQTFYTELNRRRTRLYVIVRDPQTQEMVGYIGAAYRAGVREVHITNVTVRPSWQGHGIGTFLMMYMMTVAAQIRFSRMSLEVRVSNVSAIRLYERLGFQTVRRKAGYYADNHEDAFDMAQVLGEKKQHDRVFVPRANFS